MATLSSQGLQQNMNLVANEIQLHVCAKKGWNSTYIHVLVGELWKYSCKLCLWTAFICDLALSSYTKAVTLHCAKVGGDMNQGISQLR